LSSDLIEKLSKRRCASGQIFLGTKSAYNIGAGIILDDIFKNNPTSKPQGEFVTPEGLRIKFPKDKILLEKLMGNKFFM